MHKILVPFLIGLSITGSLSAQNEETDGNAQANNPLANMTALSFQNYYISQLTSAPADAYMNTAWLRFAKPLARGKLLLRASLPVATVASPDWSTGIVRTTNGLGDVNAFLSYSLVSNATTTVGLGPMVTAPTAAEAVLGSGKWQGGLALVTFIAKDPVFQYGGLVTWQASFAGDSDRRATSIGAIQPFYFWQLGKGTYLRGSPIWGFDFENDAYSIPLALGIGRVIKVGSTVFNAYMEPQYTMISKGTQPQFQVLAGINLQFVN